MDHTSSCTSSTSCTNEVEPAICFGPACQICSVTPAKERRAKGLSRINPTLPQLQRTCISYLPPLCLWTLLLLSGSYERNTFWIPFLFNIWVRHKLSNPRSRPLWIFMDAMGNPMHPYKSWPVSLLFGSLWNLAWHYGRPAALTPVAVILSPIISISIWTLCFLSIDVIRVAWDQVRFFGLPSGWRWTLRAFAPPTLLVAVFFYCLALLGSVVGDLSLIELITVSYISSLVYIYVLGWDEVQAKSYKTVQPKRVCIVGAGWAGLYCLQHFLAAGRFEVQCFEKDDQPGGVWNYSRHRAGGISSSTYATSSIAFMHAINLAFPTTASEFPTATEWRTFMDNFIQRFDLTRHIQVNTQVVSVQIFGAGWKVLTTDPKNGRKEHVFDAVIIATGPQALPKQVTGVLSGFTGKVLHGGQYKDPIQFREHEKFWLNRQKVLVRGAGESASDILAELVQRKCDVTWSVPGPMWFAGRTFISRPAFQESFPVPGDIWLVPGWRRIAAACSLVESHTRYLVIEKLIRYVWGENGHAISEALDVSLPYLSQFVNKSRHAVSLVHLGKVKVQREVLMCRGESVVFEDGKSQDFDTVVDCLGYQPDFTMLAKMFRPHRGEWYKRVLSCRQPTLAFCGYARPVLGAIPSLSELQAAWLVSAWSGEIWLPNPTFSFSYSRFQDEADRIAIYDSSCLGVLVGINAYIPLLAGDMKRGDSRLWKLFFSGQWKKLCYLIVSPWNPRIHSDLSCEQLHVDHYARLRPWQQGIVYYLIPYYVVLDLQFVLLFFLLALRGALAIDPRLVPFSVGCFVSFYALFQHAIVRFRFNAFLPSSMVTLWTQDARYPQGDVMPAAELRKQLYSHSLKWHWWSHAVYAFAMWLAVTVGNLWTIYSLWIAFKLLLQ